MFKDKSTIDIVVLILTGVVGATVVIAMIGIIIGKIVHPDLDVQAGGEVIANVVTTIVGALIGFVGGRATGRWEQANGKS